MTAEERKLEAEKKKKMQI
jgi:hypothetical protein